MRYSNLIKLYLPTDPDDPIRTDPLFVQNFEKIDNYLQSHSGKSARIDVSTLTWQVFDDVLQEWKDTGIRLVPRNKGEWSESVEYALLDMVSLNGSSYLYLANEPSTGTNPTTDSEKWILSAHKGDIGLTPSISVGTVEALETGVEPYVEVEGTDEAPVLNFGLPKGNTGLTPNLTVGTVETVGSSEKAGVTITGTDEAPVLNFKIPKGADGEGTGDMLKAVYDKDDDGVVDKAHEVETLAPFNTLSEFTEWAEGKAIPHVDNKFSKSAAHGFSIDSDGLGSYESTDGSWKGLNYKKKTEDIDVLLSTGSWNSNKYTFSDERLTSSTDADLETSPSISDEQYEQIANARISRTIELGSGSMVLTALGDVPTVDIPLILKVRSWQ